MVLFMSDYESMNHYICPLAVFSYPSIYRFICLLDISVAVENHLQNYLCSVKDLIEEEQVLNQG